MGATAYRVLYTENIAWRPNSRKSYPYGGEEAPRSHRQCRSAGDRRHASCKHRIRHIPVLPSAGTRCGDPLAVIASHDCVIPFLSIEMARLDIAAEFRLLRIRQALSVAISSELSGIRFQSDHDFAYFYMAIPLFWNGEPAKPPLFGDAISAPIPILGWIGRGGSFLPLSKLYVAGVLFF